MNICLACEGVTAATTARCGHCGAPLLPLDNVHYPDRRGENEAGNPLLGDVVDGKYRLLGVLGRGGLGTVFHAEHTASLMRVALKLLHPRFSERAEYRRALLPEARRAATVTNEHCARLLDVGERADGGTYLAMEMVDGETLDALVRRGPLQPSHAVDLLLQIADALVAIHTAGLVHCDLSPRNVMVTQRSDRLVAKVLDFGIARPFSLAAAERVGSDLAGFVNPAFSAPEHIAGRDVDPRADLYSLGAIGWLLLTGEAPTGDLDAREAARAVVAGELRPWPNVSGVPRRLQRLLQQCLRLAPDQRPASAAAVLQELRTVRRGGRPAVARAAVAVFAVAVIATLLAYGGRAPLFFDAVARSPLAVTTEPPLTAQPLTSAQLDTLQFHFGGFDPRRLHVDLARRGELLRRVALAPEADATTGVLTLARAQPEWRSVVTSLVDTCRDSAIDLAFGVPGQPPLGYASVRVDDEPPVVEFTAASTLGEVLVAATVFDWTLRDAVGIAHAECVVDLADGRQVVLQLAGAQGRCPLGDLLAQELGAPPTAPRATVHVVATDAAGNSTRREVGPFAACDVAVPRVVAATGPLGEAKVPVVAGIARLQVRLSAAEAGARLGVRDADGRAVGEATLGTAAAIEVQCGPVDGPPLASGRFTFEVTDVAGNRTTSELPLTLRVHESQLQFRDGDAGFAICGNELVVARGGAEVTLGCSEAFRVARTVVAPSTLVGALVPDAVAHEERAPGATRLRFSALPTGGHRLEIELEARDEPTLPPLREVLPLRVLPDAIELRIRRAQSRFLPGLLAAGVLQRGPGGLYREGAGWSIEADLVPYVRGRVFVVGGTSSAGLGVPPSGGGASLLPEFLPLPGRNVLALALHDVLDRPLRVFVGDALPPTVACEGLQAAVVADFWWHDRQPEPIGEELLVERGQPLRVAFRLPLPFAPEDLGEFVLGIAQGEVPAHAIAPDGPGGAVVTFDVGFPTWSVAAGLPLDSPREVYAAQQKHTVDVYVETPLGRSETIPLTLRTTRSTLRPLRLADLADVPAALRELRLVPVLGPDGAFEEPLPAGAPPRALYRTQVATAVRNIDDMLLQDREMSWGELRAIVDAALPRASATAYAALVHADDPLGAARLSRAALLPPDEARAEDGAAVAGIDFFQAFAVCRLLGLCVAGDPDLFRLPMGVELELAAFGTGRPAAANGPAARGRPIRMRGFLGAGEAAPAYQANDAWAIGDVVTAPSQADIGGLDFGVREWVGDLPRVAGADLLLGEWIRDHGTHLARVTSYAAGEAPPVDLADVFRAYGVVRGLGRGEVDGLLDGSGQRLSADPDGIVAASVPGVLRTEQMRRDGRGLVSPAADPRLQHTGFRIAAAPARLLRLREER